ncbi:5-formyltetrahydrofolate cyclo-ligase [Paracoccus sediminis]|uniref:5-formyltetrahydrofolate cyclo-ligase n=1 Tax=Paracoccus sediminis TaxID=1214787 RepID=A0A238UZ63_9RHOB|nr:5-formyltetrahydrofolate cyclo-ligase [Paracoccus sediminis]TBN52699.1 5-formyltetrahydrofolate cyclo-ligase [Paracoccus sediminis]SNR26559.1 5-formyltetrahydrofolate cyclo-ligase [Paracoccus sediminis]
MSDADKSALRARALAARDQGGDQDALTRHLIAALAPHRGQVLAGYWPMRNEADPRPAMDAHDGPLCLPVVPGKAVPLVFRQWRGQPLVPGPFGTAHPDDSQPVLVPAVLIVPLAGFDRGGNRIGYGGGYYDRTLQLLRDSGHATAIGLAFAVQELAEIPAEPFDQPLDLIVTDQGPIRPFG